MAYEVQKFRQTKEHFDTQYEEIKRETIKVRGDYETSS